MAGKSTAGCVFCGARADSYEHLWPDWLNDVLPDYTETTYTLRGSSGIKTWQSKTAATHRLRVVCQTCNHGWMSVLEQRAKPILVPMINGRKTTLDKPQQRTLAACALKTAAIGEQLTPSEAAIPRRHRHYLREHGEPPAEVEAFLVATDPRWPADTHYHPVRLTANESVPSARPPIRRGAVIGYVATLVIRHVALQIVGPVIEHTKFPNEELAASVFQIWPFIRSTGWPTGPVLTPPVLGAFIDRFHGSGAPNPPF